MASFSILFLLISAFISLMFSFFVAIAAAQQSNITLTNFKILNFPQNVLGMGSLTFGPLGLGPYDGTTDGRVLFFSFLTGSWEDFAYTSPNRSKTICDHTNGYADPTCGIASGLSFGFADLIIYATDAFSGLVRINGILGGAPEVLVAATDVEPPMKYPNSVVAASNGMVYFTDASSKYGPKDSLKSEESGDSTGRLFEYNPSNKTVKLLMEQLGKPGGVATDEESSFLLVTEVDKNTILRYELKGDNAGTNRTFATFPGGPSKIKRAEDGNFWTVYDIINPDGTVATHRAVKLSPSGLILADLGLDDQYNSKQITTLAAQQGQELFVVGTNLTFVGRYDIERNCG